jgi:hypothetical protein
MHIRVSKNKPVRWGQEPHPFHSSVIPNTPDSKYTRSSMRASCGLSSPRYPSSKAPMNQRDKPRTTKLQLPQEFPMISGTQSYSLGNRVSHVVIGNIGSKLVSDPCVVGLCCVLWCGIDSQKSSKLISRVHWRPRFQVVDAHLLCVAAIGQSKLRVL